MGVTPLLYVDHSGVDHAPRARRGGYCTNLSHTVDAQTLDILVPSLLLLLEEKSVVCVSYGKLILRCP